MNPFKKINPFKIYLTPLILGGGVGALMGVFQWSLTEVVAFHNKLPWLLWGLPFAGLGFWTLQKMTSKIPLPCTDDYLDTPENTKITGINLLLIWTRTLWSHLFGASVGRESTALQIGGSASIFLREKFLSTESTRGHVVLWGLASALAASYQAPVAAFVFALEKQPLKARTEGVALSLSIAGAYLVSHFLFHLEPFGLPALDFDFSTVDISAYIALVFLLAAVSSITLIFCRTLGRALRSFSPLIRWTLTGIIGLYLIKKFGEVPLTNTGLVMIENAFSQKISSFDFFLKSFTTSVFVAGGWFGGDFTPNMAIGATAGVEIASQVGFVFPAMGAAMGLMLPVAFGHRLFLTGWVMTFEYFGWQIALAALPAFYFSWILRRWVDRLIPSIVN